MSELARHLRRTTEQMACTAKVDMSLWNEHSNACLDSANAVERLEAERDALRAELAAERAECLEQARLNGMGAERELKLMAQLDDERRRVAKLRGSIREQGQSL